MTTPDALLAAILADPGDDTVRLVYADAIEEAGQAERAELIRLQCELSRAVGHSAERFCDTPGRDHCRGFPPGDPECQWCRVLNRCCELLGSVRAFDPPRRHVKAFSCPGPDTTLGAPGEGCPLIAVSRGFVEGVHCTAEEWVEIGDAITARHPVRRVSLTTEPDFRIKHVAEAFCHGSLGYTDRSCTRFTCDRFPGVMFTQPASALVAQWTAELEARTA